MRRLRRHRSLSPGVLWLLLTAGSATAQVEFRPATVDLGEVRTGRQLEQKLALVNTASKAIEIVETKASCGCLTPTVDRRIVAPGESAEVRLILHTLSAPCGPHSWRVDVHYRSDEGTGQTGAVVRATVVQEVIVQPPAVLIYASGPVGHELRVTDTRPKPFRITKVEASESQFAVALTGETTDAAGRLVRTVGLQIGGDLPPGRHEAQVVIHTDDPEYRELRIPVVVVRRERQRYSAVPSTVTLIASDSQPAPSRMVTIRDTQSEPLRIERVTADHPAICCEWAQGASSAVTVKITLDRAALAGEKLDTRVQVVLQAASNPQVTIPVTCRVR